MKRREFVAVAGAAVAGGALTPHAARADDADAIKQAVRAYYSVYYADQDKKKYRSMLTDDYLLLENGEIMSADDDESMIMRRTGATWRVALLHSTRLTKP